MRFVLPRRQRLFGSGILIIMLCAARLLEAQSTQVWGDYTFNAPIAKSFLFSFEGSYRTDVSKEDKWREIEVDPILQWSIAHRIDLMLSFRVTDTHQKDGYNTDELRPTIGMRYHFAPHLRVQLRALLQFEQRNLYHQENSVWSHSMRSRFRVESLIPINKKTLSENSLWYGIADAEVFLVLDKQLDERYSNQVRLRVGIGYRASYTWRFECIYTAQFSRNNLDDGFQEASNIFRIRVKHFINKSQPAHDRHHP